MPAFILITGYFSRSFGRAENRSVRLVVQLVVPYLLFQIAYVNYDRYVGGADNHFNPYDPYGLMWFICSLVIWRASVSFWQKVRWPLALAVLVSVTAGFFPLPGEFDLHRTVGFLPFFVLGLCLKPSHFELLKERGVRIGGAALLAAVALGMWLWSREFPVAWFWYADTYRELGHGRLEGAALRLGLLALAAVVAFAFLAVVPRRRTWFTGLGQYTLYVYLLHGFVIYAAKYSGLFAEKWTRTVHGALLLSVAATVLAVVLAQPAVARILKPVVEPDVKWAFRR
ncbi:hypothetical protein GCM10027589_51510 [Actinocorallia lasiicapitis]